MHALGCTAESACAAAAVVPPVRALRLDSKSDRCMYVSAGVVEEYEDDQDSDDEFTTSKDADEGPAFVLDRTSSILPEYQPLPTEMAQKITAYPRTPDCSGMVWHASIVPDNYSNPKHVLPSGQLKPRRPLPQVRISDLVNALLRTEDGDYYCGGKLNGWPALTGLQLRSITSLPRDHKKLSFRSRGLRRVFDAESKTGGVPVSEEEVAQFTEEVLQRCTVRATFWAPPWTSRGYEADCTGRVFWFDSRPGAAPRVVLGQRMVKEALPGVEARAVHLVSHRYAKARESWKDLLTYHSAVLIEWKGASHCSVVEAAWLYGLGGYGGRSNFVPDRDSERPTLYDVMPDSLKAPWVTSLSEVRVIDMDVAGLDGFQEFLKLHTGRDKRFLEPQITHSSPVRLSYRTQADVFAGLVNYIRQNPAYAEESQNCQTFATDLFRHLSGNHTVEPFHPVCRPLYSPRTNDFLYGEVSDEL